MLKALAAAILPGAMAAACASAPPPATVPDTPTVAAPTVAARWIADDGSVVALNVVVATGTDPRRVREFAERQRQEHPAARVIVRVFAATAGPERYVLAHVPRRDGALVEGPVPSTRIALYDYPPALPPDGR